MGDERRARPPAAPYAGPPHARAHPQRPPYVPPHQWQARGHRPPQVRVHPQAPRVQAPRQQPLVQTPQQQPPTPAPRQAPPAPAHQRPPVQPRRRWAPTFVTAFSLALAPAIAGLALVLFPAAPDGTPPEKPLIQVVPRPAVAGTGTAIPPAPLLDAPATPAPR